jgi:hypothetical protein
VDPIDPYRAFERANLSMCEATVRGLVAQPANTWSNLGFFAVAAWIFWLARRERAPVAGLLAPIGFATGVGSIAFHATDTLAGQLVDQSLMFLESSFFVVVNLRRVGALATVRSLLLVYAALVVGSTAALIAFPTTGIAIFIAHVVAFLGLEAFLLARRREGIRTRALLGVGACFAVAYAAWWLDHLRIVCDPDNHLLNGHAVWHLIGALSFFFWYRHYAQLEVATSRAPLAEGLTND